MLKQKKQIAAVLVWSLLLSTIFVSILILKLSASLTNILPDEKPLASFGNFHVIAHDLDAMGDLKAECKSRLGDSIRIADWNDIVDYYHSGGSLEDFITGLKMSIREDMLQVFERIMSTPKDNGEKDRQQLLEYKPGGGYRISYNGNPRWQDTDRHFFVARHDHIMPPGFLDHANLNSYQLTVGSWFAQGGYALCYGELSEKSKEIPLASFEKFHVIEHDLDELSDHNAECKAQLGENVRLADWNDIVTYYEAGGSLDDFIVGLRMSRRPDMEVIFDNIRSTLDTKEMSFDQTQTTDLLANGYRITKDGNLRWQGSRHYFVARHDHLKPFDFLVHDELNNLHLTLGSWVGKGGFALCYGKLMNIPIPLSKALKTSMPIIAYLLIGCLVAAVTLASNHILKIPNWLLGNNEQVIAQSIEMKRDEMEALQRRQIE